MGIQAKTDKERTCKVCGKVLVTTAKGIIAHAADCGGKQ